MSVFEAKQRVVYYPAGPASRKVAEAGELIMLEDSVDSIVGTQINPAHVEKVDPQALTRAVKAAKGK